MRTPKEALLAVPVDGSLGHRSPTTWVGSGIGAQGSTARIAGGSFVSATGVVIPKSIPACC
jgi:hypothetical protein